MPSTLDRRAFLRRLTASSVALGFVGCDGGSSGQPNADASPPAPDADPAAPDGRPPACQPTRDDALGPFHQPGAPSRMNLASPGEPGERLTLTGVVLAADCATPLAGVLLDVWQADATGAYHGGAVDQYRLRGQMMTGADGRFALTSIRPGNYQTGPGAWRPAHLHFLISHPGQRTITTQVYFAGDQYLPPNDSCGACTSEDADRVVALTGDAVAGWSGNVQFVMT